MKLPGPGDAGVLPIPPGAHELRAERVCYRAGGRLILDGVSAAVRGGEALALTGPSGSGKTTLLLVLAGLQTPTCGSLLLDGRPLERGDRFRSRFGIVLQGYGLVPVLTAAENVALPLQARRLPRGEIEARTRAALAEVGLAEVAGHLAEELSGGQQQRAAVARALAGRPDLLLADEPTSELDADSRALVMRLLLAQARSGRIVVIASHDPEVAEACDRRLPLADGRVAGAGGTWSPAGATIAGAGPFHSRR